jgi:hypothetical protein
MKRSLLITLAVLVAVVLAAAGPAFAIGGNIGIFVNNTAVNCAVMRGASTSTYAIVHKNHDGSTGSAFSAPLPPCVGTSMVWISDQPVVPIVLPNDTLGSQGGVSTAYGQCRTDNVHVLSMLFNSVGVAPGFAGCCLMTVKPNFLLSPNVIHTDCSANPVEEIANGTSANVRGTGVAVGACPCNIPNEASTWGVIKELFRSGS